MVRNEEEKDEVRNILIQNRKELDRAGYLGQAGIPQSLQNPIKDVQTDSVFGGSNDMKRFGIGGFRDASVYAIQAEIKRESEDIIDVKGSVRRENTIRKNMTQGMSDIRAAKRVRCFQVLDFRALDDIESCSDLSFNFHSSNKIDSHIPKYIKNVHSFRIVFGSAKNAFQLRNDDEEVENKKSNNSDAEDSVRTRSRCCTRTMMAHSNIQRLKYTHTHTHRVNLFPPSMLRIRCVPAKKYGLVGTRVILLSSESHHFRRRLHLSLRQATAVILLKRYPARRAKRNNKTQ